MMQRRLRAKDELMITLQDKSVSLRDQMKQTFWRWDSYIQTLGSKDVANFLQPYRKYFDETKDPLEITELVRKFFRDFCTKPQPEFRSKPPQNLTSKPMRPLKHNSMIRVKSCLRKYLNVCYAIKIDMEDWSQISLPEDEEEKEEKYHMSSEEVRFIYGEADSNLKQVMSTILFTTARDGEVCQLKFSDIFENENPVRIHFRKKITKKVRGPHRAKDCYISKWLCKELTGRKGSREADGKLSDNEIFHFSARAVSSKWLRLMRKLAEKGYSKYVEKDHNGHLKMTPHRLRAYGERIITNELTLKRSREFASWYAGGTDTTRGGTYTGFRNEEASKFFQDIEEYLDPRITTVKEKIVEVANSEEIEQLKNQVAYLKRQQDNNEEKFANIQQLTQDGFYEPIKNPISFLAAQVMTELAYENKEIETSLRRFKEALGHGDIEKAREIFENDPYLKPVWKMLIDSGKKSAEKHFNT